MRKSKKVPNEERKQMKDTGLECAYISRIKQATQQVRITKPCMHNNGNIRFSIEIKVIAINERLDDKRMKGFRGFEKFIRLRMSEESALSL